MDAQKGSQKGSRQGNPKGNRQRSELGVERTGFGGGLRTFVTLLAGLLMLGIGGCASSELMVPDIEDLVDQNRLHYESQDLTESALEDRMKEIDASYAEPRQFGRLYTSYETSLGSISAKNGFAALWRGARACAAIAMNENLTLSQRKEFALKGIAFSREAVKKASTRVESYYYHALCLGVLEDLRREGSRTRLHLMRDQMKIALSLDEKYDYAGPHRFLGQLYVATDPYPTYAVGTLEGGLEHLKRAVALFPDYGENHLVYSKILAEEGQYELARAELEKVIAAPRPRDRLAEHEEWLRKANQLLTDLQGK